MVLEKGRHSGEIMRDPCRILNSDGGSQRDGSVRGEVRG